MTERRNVHPPMLPAVCYIRHPDTRRTVMILRGQKEFLPVDSALSPDQLNAGTASPPSQDQVMRMLQSAMLGWPDPEAARHAQQAPSADREHAA